ncbi:MAG: hypothetical protein ACXWLJ_07865, partial [Rhizomicrobium sp.]
ERVFATGLLSMSANGTALLRSGDPNVHISQWLSPHEKLPFYLEIFRVPFAPDRKLNAKVEYDVRYGFDERLAIFRRTHKCISIASEAIPGTTINSTANGPITYGCSAEE